MKKILFVHYSLGIIGGIETALLALLQALPRERYAIDLLLMDDAGALYHDIPPWVHILPHPLALGAFSPALMQRLRAEGKGELADMRERLRCENAALRAEGAGEGELLLRGWRQLAPFCPSYEGYDIAVAYSDTLPLKLVAEKVQAREKMVWLHSDYAFLPYSIESQLPFLAQMDKILCATHLQEVYLREQVPALQSKLGTVYTLVPVSHILKRAEAPPPEEYAHGGKNLFTAARLDHQKGIDWIVSAAALMKRAGCRFKWFIAGGEGGVGEACRRQARQLHVAGTVIFLGEVQNPYPYFAHCDLYAQPSRFEARCVGIEEAKVLGRPILATRYPTVPDSIEDGVNGLLCGTSPSAIAEAALRLLNDDALCKKLARNAALAYQNPTDQLAPYLHLFG